MALCRLLVLAFCTLLLLAFFRLFGCCLPGRGRLLSLDRLTLLQACCLLRLKLLRCFWLYLYAGRSFFRPYGLAATSSMLLLLMSQGTKKYQSGSGGKFSRTQKCQFFPLGSDFRKKIRTKSTIFVLFCIILYIYIPKMKATYL